MKKFFTFLTLILLVSILITSTTACATNISAIKPDLPTTIIMPTPENYSSPKPIPTSPNNGTTIIIPTEAPRDQEPIIIEEKPNNTTIIINDSKVPSGLIEDIFILVNQARMDAQIEPLRYNADLQLVANLRAREITERFSHTRPDGTPCYTVFPDDYNTAGENIIMADIPIATAENMMTTWMNSQGHRDNILAQRYSEIAIGIYTTETTVFAVQVFIG